VPGSTGGTQSGARHGDEEAFVMLSDILPTGSLDDVMKAYDTFGNAAKQSALEVILRNES
jgi:hypothetical protein